MKAEAQKPTYAGSPVAFKLLWQAGYDIPLPDMTCSRGGMPDRSALITMSVLVQPFQAAPRRGSIMTRRENAKSRCKGSLGW